MIDLVEKVERLERHVRMLNRMVRIIGAVTLICLMGLVFSWTGDSESGGGYRGSRIPSKLRVQEVRAKKFVLVDRKGKTLSEWATYPRSGSTALTFMYRRKIMSKYGINPRGLPFMSLYDSQHDPRFSLGFNKRFQTLMTFNDSRGRARLQLKTPRKGRPQINLYNAAGNRTDNLAD